MSRALDQPRIHRVRASESAIAAALNAARQAGLTVDKLCVRGGQVDIHCAPIERGAPEPKDDGLEQW